MKITELEVAGFGVWSGLRIENVSEGLNVLYGPNEAGKTTLLQFVRSMLYGFATRHKYLPPLHGGQPGGAIKLTGPHGKFEIGRYGNPLPDGTPAEQLTLTAPDGTRQGEHFLKVLLSNVDEPVFNNVFAIGLREIQELATLSDTEAAELLYSLSAGLDRVSLVDVLRELENSRNRILDAAGGQCQVVQLLVQREKLRGEIEEIGAVNRRYAHLAAERTALHQEVLRLQEESNHAERLARVMDLAISLRDRWARRAALDDQLSALGAVKAMPDDAVPRLDAINARLAKHQRRLEHLGQLRQAAKQEFTALPINEALLRQAARIEALKEQEPWITQLQNQIGELHGELGRFEASVAAERERLGLKAEPSTLPSLSAKILAPLRSAAKVLRQHRGRLAEAEQATALARQMAESLGQQITSALAARGQHDLSSAMDHAGSLVSQLRRRGQLDERLDQLAHYQVELEERTRRLLERQILPVGVLIGLGAVFVVGVTLLFAGLFMPTSLTGSVGWALAVLGLAGTSAAIIGKVMLERSHTRQLDACQKQLSVLQLQIQQAKEDRDGLNAQLVAGGGSTTVRLDVAEKELSSLEELSPLESRRAAASQEAEAASRRADEAKDQLRTARRRWRDALMAAGLPEQLSPRQVWRLAEHGDKIAEMQRAAAQRREEMLRRQSELDSLTNRIAQLAADSGVLPGAGGPIERLRQLAEAAARQEADSARRDTLRRQARRIRMAAAKHEEATSSLKHRRRALFIEAGVNDEQEFRQRALQRARADVLTRERDAIAAEIQAALGSECAESTIRQQFEQGNAATLEARREESRQRFTAVQQRLGELLEKRGRLHEQLQTLAADRQLAEKHLDLAIADKRLAEAIHRWQVLAVTCLILDIIRATYEKHRQPETLQEASGYLDRLTQGRYHRVWTPLGEHILKVDDAEGHALPVEVLSRGTREQLFLSLRLALASSYAGRGAPLPLVLDDVLVNFDAERAKAAAVVLRDFAAAGHQVLIFTCHEHILKLFKSLRVPVSRLPSNAQSGGCVISLERRIEEKPKRQRKAAAEAVRRKVDEADDVNDEPSDNEDDSLWDRSEDADLDDLDDHNGAAA